MAEAERLEKAWHVECALADYYHVVAQCAGHVPSTRFGPTLGFGPVSGDMLHRRSALCGYPLERSVVLWVTRERVGIHTRVDIPPQFRRDLEICPRCTHKHHDVLYVVRSRAMESRYLSVVARSTLL